MDHDHRHEEPPPALCAAAAEGCEESRRLLSRRAMMGVTAGLFSAAFLPKPAHAGVSDPRLLVVVLRGGMDGINVVVPHGDRAYAAMRGDIALPRSATLDLADDLFRLNPALPSFHAMYRAKEAAAVHATCVPVRVRSHFEGQDNLENGLPGLASNATGWLNRLLTVMPAGSKIKSRGAIQVGEAPLLLRGPAPVLGWSPTWFSHPPESITGAVTTLLRRRDPALYSALAAGMKADALAEKTSSDDGNISQFRRTFRGAGRLLSAPDGPRIAVMSVSNFDTHTNQGTTEGFLWGSLNELDVALKEFRDTTARIWPSTVVVMVTEFGRTVRVNGAGGTDHGVGAVALLAGGAVAGGKVYGDWPGIANKDLLDGSDLKATTDLRAVFKGVLRDHVGVPTKILDETIFPESQAIKPMAGLIRGATAQAALPASSVLAAAGSSEAPLRPVSGVAQYRAAYPAP